jgi:hypothetical protein
MRRTISSVSFAYPLLEPFCGGFLPRRTLSQLFSDGVPKYRWWGLTHLGLSHVCKTHLSSGIPLWIVIITKRAARWVRRFHLNNPYPSRSNPACHSQHLVLPLMFTLGQNLVSAWSRVSFIPRFAIMDVSIALTC